MLKKIFGSFDLSELQSIPHEILQSDASHEYYQTTKYQGLKRQVWKTMFGPFINRFFKAGFKLISQIWNSIKKLVLLLLDVYIAIKLQLPVNKPKNKTIA